MENAEQTGNVEEQITEELDQDDSGEQPFWLNDDDDEGEPDSSGGESGDADDADDDDADDDDGQSGDKVPVKTHVKVKQKLKGKLKDAESELEQLRRENEQLKQGKPPAQQQPQQLKPPKRPRRVDFDEEDAYEAAMDTYEEQRRSYDAQVITYTSQQNQRQSQRHQQVEQAVDQHYDRAEKLVNKYGIKPEVYQQADKNVKMLLQQAIPNLDPEMVFNNMVEMVGEGSEAAMFRIGKHKATGEEFSRLLREDQTGLKASIYLGRIAERIGNSNTKRTSQAPAPAAKARGDQVTNLKAGTAKRKWTDAHKKGRIQEAYNLKKAAKAQGIDVSTWK